MNDDVPLLRRYVQTGDNEAFAALVRRHIDLVYAAAWRRTGDPHLAADVAQEVFTAVARQARDLARHPALGAWLHAATRNVSINLMRSDQRRKQREHTALELQTMQAGEPVAEWERVRPVLDAAIDELSERDRLPVVLRFLERRPFKEIGAALAISEDAARVRTDRALEKLRTLLARRGITSTAAALSAVFSTHAGLSAPAGLAATVAPQALAAAAGSTGTLATFTAFMSIKTITTGAACALVAFVIGNYTASSRAAANAPAIPAPVQARVAPAVDAALRAENQQLRADLQRLAADVSALQAANAKLTAERAAPATPPPRPGGALGMPRHELQRAVLNNLRQLAAARDQYLLENSRPPSGVPELVGSTAYIRRMIPIDGEDYASLSMQRNGVLSVTTVSGETITYDPAGGTTTKIEFPPALLRAEQLGQKIEAPLRAATEAYRVANQGKDPRNEQALLPFFTNPQDGADFVEYLEAKKEARKY